MADPTKKQKLIQALHEARNQVAANVSGLREDLAVGKRFRRNVRENKLAWYGGAALLGLLLAKIPGRGKKVFVPQPIVAKQQSAGKAAAFLAVVKVVVDFGRPVILNWIKEHYLTNRAPRPRGSQRPRPSSVKVY